MLSQTNNYPILIGILITLMMIIQSCKSSVGTSSEPKLIREKYTSVADEANREYFVYLPIGYDDQADKSWPVMMFLHGDGERGNGLDELDYVLIHGPLYEAWIQKRDLPFIIISPQLHMFGRDTIGIDYLSNRDKSSIPQRLKASTPDRPKEWKSQDPMTDMVAITSISDYGSAPHGWDAVEADLLRMLDEVNKKYQTDQSRQYLTGLSYGGFGTWYLASKHPDRFAAISPVVGWGHPDLMDTLAERKMPIWVFAGGRDGAVSTRYFHKGLNKLEALGHKEFMYTIHEDGGHDVWKRIYAGQDLYDWFLDHQLQ